MSKYEEALEEWKQRDPYLLDFEGFERFLKEKSKEVKVHLAVSLNRDCSYSIYMELDSTYGKHLEENELSRNDQDRIIHLSDRFVEMLKKIDLRNGATHVFRKDGKWFYWGDFDHCPKEDLMFNVKQLCKLWRAVGRHIDGGFGVSKAFDRTLYVETLTNTKQWLPISIMHYDMSIFLRNINRQPIHRLNAPNFDLSGEWLNLEEVTKALLSYPEIEYDWLERRDERIPVAVVYKENVVRVEEFLTKGREEWNPFTDFEIQRNGVLELLHPTLQKELTFVWDDFLVFWEQDAEATRRIFYKKFDMEELQTKKVGKLMEICRIKKLETHGRKEELIERIADFNIKVRSDEN